MPGLGAAPRADERATVKVQLRVFGERLTPDQAALEERIFKVAQLLREQGYDCEACGVVVSKPTDSPAVIHFKGAAPMSRTLLRAWCWWVGGAKPSSSKPPT